MWIIGSHAIKNLCRRNRQNLPPDGGYGWIVVIASFLLQAISGGIAFSVGVFYVEFLDSFDETKGYTAWIGSINTGLLFGAGPLAGVLANHFTHRHLVIVGSLLCTLGLFLSAFAKSVITLCITYGVLGGVGFCFIYVPSVTIVGFYFGTRRNLAMGLAAAGFACGSFIMAPVLASLISVYGWRGTMIIASGFCLNCCVLGALLIPRDGSPDAQPLGSGSFKDNLDDPDGLQKLFSVALLTDSRFIVFLLNNILWNVGSLILLVICTDFAQSRGVDKKNGAVLISIIGFCSLIGRVLIAFIANHPRCNRFIVFTVSTGLSGVAITLYPTTSTYAFFIFFSAVYGLCFGAQLGVLAVVTSELFGVLQLTSAYGYLMFGNGAGAMLGPPIAGWLHDYTHRYDISFYFGGSVTILSSLMLLFIPYLERKRQNAFSTRHIISSLTIAKSATNL